MVNYLNFYVFEHIGMLKNLRKLVESAVVYSLVAGYAILVSPNIEVKVKNRLGKHQSVREREISHFLDELPHDSNGEHILHHFEKDLTDPGLANRIAEEFSLQGYESLISKRLENIPDVKKMPSLWLYLGFSSGFMNVKKVEAYYSPIWNTIFVNNFTTDIIYHEYMHSIGDIKYKEGFMEAAYYRMSGINVTLLNEALTEYYAQKLFRIYNKYEYYYMDEMPLAEKLGYISISIRKALKLDYDPLAKAYFIDNSLGNFKAGYEEVYGKGTFKIMLHNIISMSFR